jgi:hypothetical protein
MPQRGQRPRSTRRCDTRSQGELSGTLYRSDLLLHQQYPTRYGSKVTRCLKPSDKVPTVTRLAPQPRGDGVSASIRRSWGGMDGIVNTRARSINVVNYDKPKMLRGLSHKGTVVGTGPRRYPVMHRQHYRRTESTSPMRVHLVERAKLVSFLSPEREESRQADQRRCGYRGGQSEGRLVMRRIRGEPVVSATGLDAQAG